FFCLQSIRITRNTASKSDLLTLARHLSCSLVRPMKNLSRSILHVAMLIVLTVGSGVALAGGFPRRQNLCHKALEAVAMAIVAPLADTAFILTSTRRRYLRACQLKKLTAGDCAPSGLIFESLAELLEWGNSDSVVQQLITSHRNWQLWNPEQLWVGRYGTMLGTQKHLYPASVLEEIFAYELNPKMAAIANESIAALKDREAVLSWVRDLKTEALTRMYEDGIVDLKSLLEPELNAHYVDLSLARRAALGGFKIRRDGHPFRMVTYNVYSFQYALARGKFFIDEVGGALGSAAQSGSNQNHGMRGHSLPMAYLAETVPGFVELIKLDGRTLGRRGIFELLFDNAGNIDTPFWTGFWENSFTEFLAIPRG
ncbi:MAG: hypothetical protein AAF202_04785, partial [Pseudomonadota bacterium]